VAALLNAMRDAEGGAVRVGARRPFHEFSRCWNRKPWSYGLTGLPAGLRPPIIDGMAESGDRRTDEDLLAAVHDGDPGALEALILRYQPRVYRFGVKMCRDLEDAGDVVQETLVAMARSIRAFRADSSVSSWLYTIARSFCIKKRRRSKFAPGREESLETLGAHRLEGLSDPSPDPEQETARREVEASLTAAIDSLDVGQREVLVLRDVEGLSAPEVAKILGLSVQAVKSRLHRARLAVRQQVAPVLGIPAVAASQRARCPDVLRLFSRHLEGEIAPEVCAEMEAHLERCGDCHGACETLRRTLALCRAMPAPDVPASLRESVRHAIRIFLDQQPA
jgi:RNA polymerase sigma-70 factor, ECF subfamily